MENVKQQVVKWSTYFLFAMLAVGFSACDNDDDKGEPEVVSEQDRAFVINASFSNRAEIELGELASERATNESVRAFAEMMVEDHTTAQNQLEEIASDLNIATPDTLDAVHQAIYAQLSALSGYQFDSAYIRSQVLDHELAQEIMQTQIDEGKNERLVGYASQKLPIINQHLQEVLELQIEVIENGNNGNDGDTGTDGDANE